MVFILLVLDRTPRLPVAELVSLWSSVAYFAFSRLWMDDRIANDRKIPQISCLSEKGSAVSAKVQDICFSVEDQIRLGSPLLEMHAWQ